MNGCLYSFNFKCDEEEKREGRKIERKAIRLAGLQFFLSEIRKEGEVEQRVVH